MLRGERYDDRPLPKLSMEYSVRLMLPFALAAIFVLVGVMLDGNYQRSTPEPNYAQGTVVGFERPQAKRVYPIFEFKDSSNNLHRVVNSSQQAIVRLATGDAVPIAYSQSDPQRARIDTFWFNHRWIVGALIVALSLVFGAFVRRSSRVA
jgi:translation initiation factor IF-1